MAGQHMACVAPDEDDIGLAHMILYTGADKEVAAAAEPHHLLKAWFIDRQLVTHPGSNSAEEERGLI